MKFEIKNRWSGQTIYQDEAESSKALVIAAIKSGADLGGADLGGADLCGAKNISDKLNAETSIVPETGGFQGWKMC